MKKWLLAMSLSALILLPQEGCFADEFDNIPKMTVKGEASVFKPADQMEVSLGVVTSADQSSDAVEANNEHIRQIISKLKSLGLDEKDYQTGRFHVKPVYQKPAKDSDVSEQGKISHYEAFNSIQVKTPKIALADQIINAAVQGGANQITQVNFNLQNPQSYREEAIKLASQYALADANALAGATDVKIKRILNLSMDYWHNAPQPYMLKARGAAFAAQAAGDEVMEPGQTEIHAVVNILFEIGS